MTPYGYVFNGRFYKSLDELRGRTMSEDNKPIAVYSDQQTAELKAEIDILKEEDNMNKGMIRGLINEICMLKLKYE